MSGHCHHHHHHHKDSPTSKLALAFALNLGFACIEIAGGLWTNSVAVLADAAHDIGDAAALGLAWYLQRLSARPPDERYSFGYARMSLLGGLLTAGILVVGSVLVMVESFPRLLAPEAPHAPGMLGLAVLGVVVNGAAAFQLRGGRTLNERVASWHLIEDLLGWIAVLIVATVMLFVDLPILDPLLAIVIGVWVLFHAANHGRRAAHLFLQGAPDELSLDVVEGQLLAVEGVGSLHHVRVWSLDGERHVVTAHIEVAGVETLAELRELKQRLKAVGDQLPLEFTTFELELGPDDCSKPDG